MLRLLVLAFVVAVVPPVAATVDVSGTTEAAGRTIAEAVVWIEAPDAPPPPAHPPAVLDQRNTSFSPHVLAVQVGTIVKFPNDDLVFHNVFSFHDGKKFNLGMYPVGAVKNVLFDSPGLSRVFCNIHPQMSAYVMAVDTPFYAVSDAHGEFVIRGLPRGTFVYHAWRAGADILTGQVEAGASDRLTVAWP